MCIRHSDSNPLTLAKLDGDVTVEIPAGVREYVILTGTATPAHAEVTLTDKKGNALGTSKVKPYTLIAVPENAKSLTVSGVADIYEIIGR